MPKRQKRGDNFTNKPLDKSEGLTNSSLDPARSTDNKIKKAEENLNAQIGNHNAKIKELQAKIGTIDKNISVIDKRHKALKGAEKIDKFDQDIQKAIKANDENNKLDLINRLFTKQNRTDLIPNTESTRQVLEQVQTDITSIENNMSTNIDSKRKAYALDPELKSIPPTEYGTLENPNLEPRIKNAVELAKKESLSKIDGPSDYIKIGFEGKKYDDAAKDILKYREFLKENQPMHVYATNLISSIYNAHKKLLILIKDFTSETITDRLQQTWKEYQAALPPATKEAYSDLETTKSNIITELNSIPGMKQIEKSDNPNATEIQQALSQASENLLEQKRQLENDIKNWQDNLTQLHEKKENLAKSKEITIIDSLYDEPGKRADALASSALQGVIAIVERRSVIMPPDNVSSSNETDKTPLPNKTQVVDKNLLASALTQPTQQTSDLADKDIEKQSPNFKENSDGLNAKTQQPALDTSQSTDITINARIQDLTTQTDKLEAKIEEFRANIIKIEKKIDIMGQKFEVLKDAIQIEDLNRNIHQNITDKKESYKHNTIKRLFTKLRKKDENSIKIEEKMQKRLTHLKRINNDIEGLNAYIDKHINSNQQQAYALNPELNSYFTAKYGPLENDTIDNSIKNAVEQAKKPIPEICDTNYDNVISDIKQYDGAFKTLVTHFMSLGQSLTEEHKYTMKVIADICNNKKTVLTLIRDFISESHTELLQKTWKEYQAALPQATKEAYNDLETTKSNIITELNSIPGVKHVEKSDNPNATEIQQALSQASEHLLKQKQQLENEMNTGMDNLAQLRQQREDLKKKSNETAITENDYKTQIEDIGKTIAKLDNLELERRSLSRMTRQSKSGGHADISKFNDLEEQFNHLAQWEEKINQLLKQKSDDQLPQEAHTNLHSDRQFSNEVQQSETTHIDATWRIVQGITSLTQEVIKNDTNSSKTTRISAIKAIKANDYYGRYLEIEEIYSIIKELRDTLSNIPREQDSVLDQNRYGILEKKESLIIHIQQAKNHLETVNNESSYLNATQYVKDSAMAFKEMHDFFETSSVSEKQYARNVLDDLNKNIENGIVLIQNFVSGSLNHMLSDAWEQYKQVFKKLDIEKQYQALKPIYEKAQKIQKIKADLITELNLIPSVMQTRESDNEIQKAMKKVEIFSQEAKKLKDQKMKLESELAQLREKEAASENKDNSTTESQDEQEDTTRTTNDVLRIQSPQRLDKTPPQTEIPTPHQKEAIIDIDDLPRVEEPRRNRSREEVQEIMLAVKKELSSQGKQIEQLVKDKQDLHKTIDSLKSEISQKDMSIENLKQERQKSEEQIQRQNERYQLLQSKKDNKIQEQKSHINGLEKDTHKQLKALHDDIKNKAKTIEEHEKNLNALKTQVSDLEQESQRLNNQIESHKQSYKALRENKDKTIKKHEKDIVLLNAQVSNLEQKSQKLNKQTEAQGTQIDLLHNDVKSKNEEVRELQIQISKQETSSDAQRQAIKQKDNSISELHGQLGNTTGRNAELVDQNKQLEGEIRTQAQENEALHREIARQAEIINQYLANFNEGNKQVHNLTAKYENALREKDRQITNATGFSTELLNTITGLEKAITGHEITIAGLNRTIADHGDLPQRIEQLKKDKTGLEDENNALRLRIATTQHRQQTDNTRRVATAGEESEAIMRLTGSLPIPTELSNELLFGGNDPFDSRDQGTQVQTSNNESNSDSDDRSDDNDSIIIE